MPDADKRQKSNPTIILSALVSLATLSGGPVDATEESQMNPISIDEGRFVPINGKNQWITVRGDNIGNPVLLILSGPGVALSPAAPFFETWERHFTLVHWDQPGSGATVSADPDPAQALTIERLVKDGIGVTEFVRQRLDIEELAVVGVSGGSVVGLTMMHEHPEYFSAYIGAGQFVNWSQQDALGYELLLKKSRTDGNLEAEQELLTIGQPPYQDSTTDTIKSKYHSALTLAEMKEFAEFSAIMNETLTNPSSSATYVPEGIAIQNPRTLAKAAYEDLRDELLGFDARKLPMEYVMPVFFFQGEEDYYSVTSIVQDYADEISAPHKEVVVIAGASHSVFWLRQVFLQELIRVVMPVIGKLQ